MRSFIRSFFRSFVSFVRSFVSYLIHSLAHSLIHSTNFFFHVRLCYVLVVTAPLPGDAHLHASRQGPAVRSRLRPDSPRLEARELFPDGRWHRQDRGTFSPKYLYIDIYINTINTTVYYKTFALRTY